MFYIKNYISGSLRSLCLIAFLFSGHNLMAQDGHRVFNYKPGDAYEVETLTNSRAIVQRGQQSLEINTVSSVNKVFTNTMANDRGFTFNAKITHLETEIEAMGMKLSYNSAKKNDTTSRIIKAIDFMVNKPVDIQINRNGIIQSYTDYKAELATDTLVSFTGMQPEAFEKGTMLNFMADFTYRPDMQKKYVWTDSIEVDKQRITTKFWVEDVNDKHAVVKFESKIGTALLNSNQNGTYVIDHVSGLIIEKILYTITTGYQISAGGVIYAVSRSTSVSQKIRKVK